MIKEFLGLTDEARVRLVIWLYHRYIVRPYLREQARQLEELGELDFDIVIELEEPTLH